MMSYDIFLSEWTCPDLVDSLAAPPWPEGSRVVGTLYIAGGAVAVERFRGELADGRSWIEPRGWVAVELHAADLVGLHWDQTRCTEAGVCTTIRYRITGSTMDRTQSTMPAYGDNSDIWLYEVEYAMGESRASRASPRRRSMPLSTP